MNNSRRRASETSIDLAQAAMEIVVPFTTPALTRAALRTAGQLALDLNVKIRVIWAQDVPYRFPIDRPPVGIAFFKTAMRDLLEQYSVVAEHYLTRDSEAIWAARLQPNSLIVLATPKRPWRTQQEKLAEYFRRIGHDASCFTLGPGKLESWARNCVASCSAVLRPH